MEEGITELGVESEPPEISLHTIVRSPNLRIMRLMRRVKGQPVVILVDTGNTHNFLDPTIVSKTHLTLNFKEQMERRVANGNRIKSEGKLDGAEIMVKGHVFTIDFILFFYFFATPFGGCDIVLEM